MSSTNLERAHFIVVGRVQGVGYRQSTVITANALGVRGWVRNLPDGTVEVTAEAETNNLDALLDWCAKGPARAVVSEIKTQSRETIDQFSFDDFTVE
jgi:acylphosphatase